MKVEKLFVSLSFSLFSLLFTTLMFRLCRVAQQVRLYSHAPALTRPIIASRVEDLLRSYARTPATAAIQDSTSLHKDLGFDSFDTVEVLMELEHEFSILIPDREADEIKTVGQAIDYIEKQADAC